MDVNEHFAASFLFRCSARLLAITLFLSAYHSSIKDILQDLALVIKTQISLLCISWDLFPLKRRYTGRDIFLPLDILMSGYDLWHTSSHLVTWWSFLRRRDYKMGKELILDYLLKTLI